MNKLIWDVFFNYIGASLRFILGTLTKSKINNKHFTFKEYIYGQDSPNNSFDNDMHRKKNKFVGLIFLAGLFLLIYLI